VQVSFQLTPEDVRQGMFVWRTIKLWRRWLLRCSYLLMGLTIPAAGLLLYVRPGSQTLKTSAAIWAFAAFWFTFMLAAPRFSARRQFRGNPSAQSAITVMASDAGMELHSAHVESKVSWSAYVAWAEGKTVFVILPQPRTYVIIPKRALTLEQIGEFREILGRNIQPYGK
jgi:hypothetical protein